MEQYTILKLPASLRKAVDVYFKRTRKLISPTVYKNIGLTDDAMTILEKHGPMHVDQLYNMLLLLPKYHNLKGPDGRRKKFNQAFVWDKRLQRNRGFAYNNQTKMIWPTRV